MVCSAGLIACAVMQHSRLISSALVAAISSSASSTLARRSTSMVAQLPVTVKISYCSMELSSTRGLESISVRSLPSSDSCRVSVAPTLPSPAMMIFMSSHPYYNDKTSARTTMDLNRSASTARSTDAFRRVICPSPSYHFPVSCRITCPYAGGSNRQQ